MSKKASFLIPKDQNLGSIMFMLFPRLRDISFHIAPIFLFHSLLIFERLLVACLVFLCLFFKNLEDLS